MVFGMRESGYSEVGDLHQRKSEYFESIMYSGHFQIDTMVMDLIVSVILLFTAIAVLVTIHICIVGRAFTRGGFDINAANIAAVLRSSSKRLNMSVDDIGKLPSFDYNVEEERGKVTPMECCLFGEFRGGGNVQVAA